MLIAREYLAAAARELSFFCVRVILSWLGSKSRDLRWRALELAAQRNEILESISDGFAALDPNCRFAYLNRTAEQLTQRPRAQTIGKSLWADCGKLYYG
jgi:PAS domain-containing protein